MVSWTCPECGRDGDCSENGCIHCGPVPAIPDATEPEEVASDSPPLAVLCKLTHGNGTGPNNDVVADWSVAPMNIRLRPPILGSHFVDIPQGDWDALHQLAKVLSTDAQPALEDAATGPVPALEELPATDEPPPVTVESAPPIAEPADTPALIPEVVSGEPRPAAEPVEIFEPITVDVDDDGIIALVPDTSSRILPGWLVSLMLTFALIAGLCLFAFLLFQARSALQTPGP